MERYAPTAKDLASRDVVSRSMTIEIREGRYVCVCVWGGRGGGGGGHVGAGRSVCADAFTTLKSLY